MGIKMILVFCFFITIFCQNYENQESWNETCKKGSYQSPININYASVKPCSKAVSMKLSIDLITQYTQPAYD